MKNFISKNKKFLAGVAFIWGILLVLFIVNLIFSLGRTKNYIDEIGIKSDSTVSVAVDWNNPEIQNLVKEKLWLEQQLLLAKSDSFSLGINLKDSIVQVQLKGTVLFQSKILLQKPTFFFTNLSKQNYTNIFGEVMKIDTALCNVSKRPITIVMAPPIGTEKETTKLDSTKVECLNWTFMTSNQIKIVIYGVQQNSDSTQNIHDNKDIFNYRLNEDFSNPFSQKYAATLFFVAQR